MQKYLQTNSAVSICSKSESRFGSILSVVFALIFFQGLLLAQSKLNESDKLAVSFAGKYGQVEVGGNYAGAEFHRSLPLPSRISFYYPVANSIDLSTDYWKRGDSHLFSVVVNVDEKTDTVGVEPCVYSWTPYEASFFEDKGTYAINYTYQFCDDLPLAVVRMKFTNQSTVEKNFQVRIKLSTVLRTCQTYAFKDTAEVRYIDAGKSYAADFKYRDTDSASVFVVNAGDAPSSLNANDKRETMVNPQASFSYSKLLSPSGKLEIILLVGSCRIDEESRMMAKALGGWRKSVAKSEARIGNYLYHDARLSVTDRDIEQSAYWSKAELAVDKHYIDGSVVPMPCPAEYNFFFTHDVLLTNLGAVFYDAARVKSDLLFIKSLCLPDSILPHAFYWRDDGFKTEFASANNWNHLWFMILCGTYLKHSGDTATVAKLYPILKKSVSMTLSNLGPGDVMYSTRPDWWDVGDNYGARAYLTALMVRALREYSYVALRLGRDMLFASECLKTSDVLQTKLADKFWNEHSGYLLDTFDTSKTDLHYYAGPLVAVDYGLLDSAKAITAVKTAGTRLLDDSIGVRTAMPADFDTLASLYNFKPGEVGAPYVYINGGVWSQTTAWYILALSELGEVDAAESALKKYSTLTGIEHSPNGQPSFYEYRFSDPASPGYGRIDKPNFMWAGGWYLNSLYHLMGVRENEWNISVTPRVPANLHNSEYSLTVEGSEPIVKWSGSGNYFKRISADGKSIHTAVLTDKMKKVGIELGVPDAPYLAGASCVVRRVNTLDKSGSLKIGVAGLPGQKSSLKVVSPRPVKEVTVAGVSETPHVVRVNGVYEIEVSFIFDKQVESATFEF